MLSMWLHPVWSWWVWPCVTSVRAPKATLFSFIYFFTDWNTKGVKAVLSRRCYKVCFGSTSRPCHLFITLSIWFFLSNPITSGKRVKARWEHLYKKVGVAWFTSVDLPTGLRYVCHYSKLSLVVFLDAYNILFKYALIHCSQSFTDGL